MKDGKYYNNNFRMFTTLKFKKDVGANVYQPKVDDYTVIDPRQGYLSLINL